MAERTWIGSPPTACDLCKAAITNEFFDAKTQFGPWANLCPLCFLTHAVGLGTGKGQKYQKNRSGRFIKVEG